MITDEKVDQIIEAIRPTLGSWTGVVVEERGEITRYRDGRNTAFTIEIEQDLGVFRGIIRNVELRINICEFNDTEEGQLFLVTVGLAYSHPSGGRNGSDIGQIDLKEDLTILHTYTEHQRADDNEARFREVTFG